MSGYHAIVSQCFRKKHYDSLLEARKAATKSWLVNGKQLWPYTCDICDRWHLTSKTPEEQIEKGYDTKLK
jgi:hypothetical protein